MMNVLGREVKEIDLRFSFPDLYKLVRDFFYMCSSVEVVILDWKMLVEIPENVKLSKLRVLSFSDVTFSSYESVEKLLLNCPVLEDLSIDYCEWLTGNSLSICGSVLKRLSYCPSSDDFVLRTLIDTPRLENLEIHSYTAGDNDILFKENLPFLKVAEIDICDMPRGVDCMFGLLKKISNVKFLTLSDNAMGVLRPAYENEFIIGHYEFPPFHNLTELVLNIDLYCHETLLDNFLQNSPNLETLKFPQGLVCRFFDDSFHRSWGWSQLRVPECFSTHLKTVHIKKFNGINEELAFVKFLLVYGSALQNVSIETLNLSKDAEARQELLNLQRESTTCKLNIIDENGKCFL
ncbi:F-box/LRR-repeat protein At4g14096 isoform X2 [Daucus carota subsp. sativus]|nr:PREDICTED: F-box/LRR-repeat protein At4g14096-like isoform X2 [Daucus carota subsp. sativus]